MNTRLSQLSIYALLLAGISLIISIFVPIWRIDLDAPQYPEGLRLLIHANKLAGNVDIVNGLNHYIGMKTLHAEEFVEFTVLPYIIGFFAFLCFMVAFAGNRKWVNFLLILFALFGILAMYDFWRWEYEYGHNLDPNAAIIVPGMAYQPPLIGFKQLLNFGAYSIPDIGGWLFVLAGVLMSFAAYREFKVSGVTASLKSIIILIVATLALSACTASGPEPIVVNKDVCFHCKMNISDVRFGAELITTKGRVYKFDDVVCMKWFASKMAAADVKATYVCAYTQPGHLVNTDSLFFIRGENIASPMRGNVAAFTDRAVMQGYLETWKAVEVDKAAILNP